MGLVVENLQKQFGSQTICLDFSLKMNSGEITLLVGESGSGKTTVLRMLNHLETVDNGTVAINDNYLVRDGKYVANQDLKIYQRSIGYVFQDYQLFPQLSVLENILLAPLSNQVGSRNELEKQATQWLERLGLADKAMAYPTILSGGQKQRVAIIRAMMMNPALLCCDEPTSALDEQNTREFVQIVKELQAMQTMMIIVTHDQFLIEQLKSISTVIDAKELKVSF
ncbi:MULTISPECIES: ATP-binding cassette domain-containing protein [unclassified Facklamia]|uniref:ATP-binding cassette domain-containing protein n=1 Tax=Aerococcaceae TaxID=186827 RepID=UPI0013B8AA53|nr:MULTISPECIES: ATP-binding cassette domain-containing protein [unclassified Facklamia]NEW63951.1 ATP-binding cassette domain-containing protein [Facklamia sp. 252]NEW67422.1 ATP-binding cassette domain-containing protein [Facklamia sp. 253]QQD65296.1 amino acid ABC transporter ATP-binding protein [Aerococcaceae bacterium zg-252]